MIVTIIFLISWLHQISLSMWNHEPRVNFQFCRTTSYQYYHKYGNHKKVKLNVSWHSTRRQSIASYSEKKHGARLLNFFTHEIFNIVTLLRNNSLACVKHQWLGTTNIIFLKLKHLYTLSYDDAFAEIKHGSKKSKRITISCTRKQNVETDLLRKDAQNTYKSTETEQNNWPIKSMQTTNSNKVCSPSKQTKVKSQKPKMHEAKQSGKPRTKPKKGKDQRRSHHMIES